MIVLIEENLSHNFDYEFKDKILIYGDNCISDFLKLYLSGLGFDKIIHVKPHLKKKNNLFKKSLDNLGFKKYLKNIKIVNHNIETIFLENISLIVDCNNDFDKKNNCLNLANKIGLPYISLASNRHSFEVSFNVLPENNYENFDAGYFTSSFASAIAIDEIRKLYYKLPDDQISPGCLSYNLFNNERIGFSKLEKFKPKKSEILLIGAGGIGSNMAMNLALEGYNVNIYDHDVVEESNLNRQIFYHDNIGKNKSQILGEFCKKSKLAGKIIPHSKKFSLKELFDLNNCSIIVSCVDNWKTRLELNDLALLSNTPFLNLSVTTFSASSEFYVPGKAFCIKCKHNLKSDNLKASCSTLENNVITTNAAIAAFGTGEIIALTNNLPQKYYDFKYFSQSELDQRFRFYNGNCLCNCALLDCKCHER